MIAYVTIGITDIHRTAKFYEPLAEEIGARRMMGSEEENFIAWIGPDNAPGIGILHPFDGKPATATGILPDDGETKLQGAPSVASARSPSGASPMAGCSLRGASSGGTSARSALTASPTSP
jgi:hypothetical protein